MSAEIIRQLKGLLLLHQIHLGSYVSVMSTKTIILLFLSGARAKCRCVFVQP